MQIKADSDMHKMNQTVIGVPQHITFIVVCHIYRLQNYSRMRKYPLNQLTVCLNTMTRFNGSQQY